MPGSSHRHWQDEKSKVKREHPQNFDDDDDDDDSCGFICFALGVILLFAGVAVLATVLVYSQSTDPRSRVVSLTSTRPVKYVSESLLDAIENPHSMHIIDYSSIHNRTKTLLLIIVHSLAEHGKRRNDIRNSWMKETKSKDLNTVVRFAVPAKGIPPEILTSVKEESMEHKDVVVFLDSNDVPESEAALFHLIWGNMNYNFLFVMKARDSIYIRVEKLLKDVMQNLERSNSNTYLGYFEGNGDPKGQEKLAEPDWFLCDNFIRFAHSGGYILSHTLVARLLSQAEFLHPYNNEDVAMGTWLSPFKDINWSHNINFDTNIGHSRGCKNDMIVLQPAVGEMVTMHDRLSNHGQLCEREFEDIQAYYYNFDTLPSKCCTTV